MCGVERAWLFDKHVLAGLHGGQGDGRERSIQRGDDHGVHRGVGEGLRVVGDGGRAGAIFARSAAWLASRSHA
ncbi:MAG: hypothetical protein WDM96_18605 [Lacunisphaera sp.]